MFGIFDGPVNAWRNASLDSAKLSVEIEIGDRTSWLFPVVIPRAKKLINDVLVRPTKALVGMVTRPEPKEPAAMPELPREFETNSLGEDLKKTYEQRCQKVAASAESTKCMLRLDLTGMRQKAAVAVHQQALDRVSLPENQAPTAAVSAAGGTVIGDLVANIPPEVKNAAKNKLTGVVKQMLA